MKHVGQPHGIFLGTFLAFYRLLRLSYLPSWLVKSIPHFSTLPFSLFSKQSSCLLCRVSKSNFLSWPLSLQALRGAFRKPNSDFTAYHQRRLLRILNNDFGKLARLVLRLFCHFYCKPTCNIAINFSNTSIRFSNNAWRPRISLHPDGYIQGQPT